MARPENSSSVTVTTDTSALSNSCKQKVITVSTSPISLKVDSQPLKERTALIIQANKDNKESVYIGIGTVSTSNYFMELVAGQGVALDLQKYSPVEIFAVAPEVGHKVSICEVI